MQIVLVEQRFRQFLSVLLKMRRKMQRILVRLRVLDLPWIKIEIENMAAFPTKPQLDVADSRIHDKTGLSEK